MRKNLHYKVLASVLAIAGLYFYNAPAAWADDFKYVDGTTYIWIGNGTITNNYNEKNEQIQTTASVYGWHSQFPAYGNNADNNKITINGSTLSKVSGANSKNNNVTNNEVTINNSNIQNVYGGESESGTASGNKVLITNTENTAKEFYKIIGGSTGSSEAKDNEAKDNTVTINGNVTLKDSNVYYIAGGEGSNDSTVSDNHVIIEGGTVIGNIYGGYGTLYADGTTISGNKITVKNSANVEKANLYGGYNRDNSYSTNIKDNKLIIDGWSGSVGSLKNFDFIDFENIDISKNTTLTSDNISFINTPTITIKSIKADDLKLSAGDYKKDSKINLSNISWSAGLGNNVMVDGSVNETLSALSDYYTTDNADKLNHEIDKDNYQVNFSANVDKSILTGKFIDKNGAHFNSKQTEETAALTISDGFTTEVGTVAGVYAASGNNATGGKLIISGNTTYGKDLYGAYAENGNAENSTVEISGDTNYKGTVYAGYSEVKKAK